GAPTVWWAPPRHPGSVTGWVRLGPGAVSGLVGAGRAEVLAGLDDASGHAGLGLLAPGAGVVGLLVADVAVDLQHAVVVLEDVRGHGAGDGVLGVGVDVQLDGAVVQRLGDLRLGGAGATVHGQVEWLDLAVLLTDALLDVIQDLRAQLHVARLVDAVDVAERQGGQVAAALTQAELGGGLQTVLGRGEQLLVGDVGRHAVLLAAHDADLDLEQLLGLDGLLQEALGDLEVLVDRDRGAVPHVGLEQGVQALLDAVLQV